ncbi:MAG: shikimate kinase [Chitinophagales bacterium]|nr:shikimate kinase [Chitinophagales bacterium]
MKPVFIVGFMGAGKTGTGKRLANALKLEFIDVDWEIEKRIKKSISELVLKEGIEEFRTIEHDVLISLNYDGKLIATGGGTPCFYDNMEYMNSLGTTVFFDVNEEILFSRLRSQEHRDRPLIASLSGEELRDFIQKSLVQRRPFYETANLTFNPVKMHVDEMAKAILAYEQQTTAIAATE